MLYNATYVTFCKRNKKEINDCKGKKMTTEGARGCFQSEVTVLYLDCSGDYMSLGVKELTLKR